MLTRVLRHSVNSQMSVNPPRRASSKINGRPIRSLADVVARVRATNQRRAST